MAALALLRRLAVREICLVQELQDNYAYAVLAVDRIIIWSHRWCILHLEKDYLFSKVLLQSDAFTEEEELLICIGLLLYVLVYTGRNVDGKLTCRMATYDTVVGAVGNQ